MNPGGGGYSELRLCHCTSAWVTEPESISTTKILINKVILNSQKQKAQYRPYLDPLNFDRGSSGDRVQFNVTAFRIVKAL